jgi:hypothetical protein
MDALRQSLSTAGKATPQPAKGRKPKKAAAGQREMLMAIRGKGGAKSEAKSKGAGKETKRAAVSARRGSPACRPSGRLVAAWLRSARDGPDMAPVDSFLTPSCYAGAVLARGAETKNDVKAYRCIPSPAL